MMDFAAARDALLHGHTVKRASWIFHAGVKLSDARWANGVLPKWFVVSNPMIIGSEFVYQFNADDEVATDWQIVGEDDDARAAQNLQDGIL